jgi:hypothetical protein
MIVVPLVGVVGTIMEFIQYTCGYTRRVKAM